MNIHDFAAPVTVGNTDLDLPVKPSGSSESRVQGITTVRGSNYDHVVTALHPVHEREHLCDDAPFNLTGDVLSLGTNRVDFVNKHDGGGIFCSLIKDFTELFFRFPVVFGDDFRPVNTLEVGVDFGGHSLGNHGLPCARWPVEENAFRWVNAQPAKQFWMLQRQFNHLTNLLELLADATHVFVGDAFALADFLIGNGFVFDDDFGVRGDLDDALGHGLYHGERQRLCKQRHAGNEDTITGNDGSLGKASLGEAFNSWPKLDLLLVGHHGRNGEFCAVLSVHLGYRHAVA